MVHVLDQKGIDLDAWQHLTGWRTHVFPREGEGMQWSEVSCHVLAYSDGDLPIAHLGYDVFTVKNDGRSLDVIGIGGVVVRPEYQGQGIPAQLFEHLHTQVSPRLGLDTFILFCPDRLVAYYEKLGYRHHGGPVLLRQWGEQQTCTRFNLLYHNPSNFSGTVELTSPPW